MVKCNRCKDGRDYVWDMTYNESTGKWRLWDSEREFPHKCDEKKKEVKVSKLWKTAWKPEMDEPSYILCGICNDGTECVVVTDCNECEKFGLNPCKHWCPKCKEHPRISYHARNKMERLENVKSTKKRHADDKTSDTLQIDPNYFRS